MQQAHPTDIAKRQTPNLDVANGALVLRQEAELNVECDGEAFELTEEHTILIPLDELPDLIHELQAIRRAYRKGRHEAMLTERAPASGQGGGMASARPSTTSPRRTRKVADRHTG